MKIFSVVAFAAVLAVAVAKDCLVYLPDENDVIRMDMEQRGPGGGWEFMDSLVGYGGSGYLVYKPHSNFGGAELKPKNMDDPRIKTYFFKVNTPGRYRVVIRSAAPHATEHNDVFMALPESGAYMVRDSNHYRQLTWPMSPEGIRSGEGSHSNWFKVYQNTGGLGWHTGGVTKDHDGHYIVTRPLKNDGTWYSVRICGRSTQFNVDRIIVFRCQGAECNTGSPTFHAAVHDYWVPQNTCDGPHAEVVPKDVTHQDTFADSGANTGSGDSTSENSGSQSTPSRDSNLGSQNRGRQTTPTPKPTQVPVLSLDTGTTWLSATPPDGVWTPQHSNA